MPFVHVMITKDGVTREKKAKLIADITNSLVQTLNKKPEQTHIVIEEVDTDNWGFMGMLTTDYRKMHK
jgi:4-oxalocrotonate tautomerase